MASNGFRRVKLSLGCCSILLLISVPAASTVSSLSLLSVFVPQDGAAVEAPFRSDRETSEVQSCAGTSFEPSSDHCLPVSSVAAGHCGGGTGAATDESVVSLLRNGLNPTAAVN